jgi:hypothetical protein
MLFCLALPGPWIQLTYVMVFFFCIYNSCYGSLLLIGSLIYIWYLHVPSLVDSIINRLFLDQCICILHKMNCERMLRRIFLSNCWWQKSDIWSHASYRYTILWVAFLDPSDSYFLFADFVDFYTHWTYMLIFRRIFLSN